MDVRVIGIVLVLLAVVLESFGQFCLKKSATPGGATILMWVGIALYVVEIVLWTFALHNIDVSIAFPMSALCFVGVALLSHFYLKENVSPKRWIGVMLILIGTGMVGLS